MVVMSSRLHRSQLTRAATALNAAHGAGLPALILMTDERRLKDPVAAAWALPKGSAIILRHTQAEARASLAERLAPIAKARGLLLLIAGDAALAVRVKASGLHLSQARMREAAQLKARHPHWLITAAAHSLAALATAKVAHADAALLAPVFATQSHLGRPFLGAARARMMARQAPLPVYALGGIDARSIGRLKGGCFAGIAGVGALAPPYKE
jgi:thiamine-phosphate pyrophosphorylase